MQVKLKIKQSIKVKKSRKHQKRETKDFLYELIVANRDEAAF